MTRHNPTYFPNGADYDLNGEWNPVIFSSGGISISGGYTPLELSPTVFLGFMGKANASFSYGEAGSYTVLGLDESYTYTGGWLSFSPMAAFRFQIGRNSFINLGAGASIWKYTSMSLSESFYGMSGDYNLSSLDGSSGVSPAAYASINWGWNTIEIGLTGPDVFLGWGVTF